MKKTLKSLITKDICLEITATPQTICTVLSFPSSVTRIHSNCLIIAYIMDQEWANVGQADALSVL